MKVVYRMCDIPSTNPPPILKSSKLMLNIHCLKSFVEAFRDIKPEMIFLCDHTRDYEDTLAQNVPFKYTTEYSNKDINYTYLRSLELGREMEDDVLFQECDYVYKPLTGRAMMHAVKNFGFISPYDHPDKYPGDGVKLRNFREQIWRNTPSTTMTYMATKDNIKDHYDLLTKHGYLDHQMWVELTQKTGKELWTPIPSFATHMVESHLAPGMKQ